MKVRGRIKTNDVKPGLRYTKKRNFRTKPVPPSPNNVCALNVEQARKIHVHAYTRRGAHTYTHTHTRTRV